MKVQHEKYQFQNITSNSGGSLAELFEARQGVVEALTESWMRTNDAMSRNVTQQRLVQYPKMAHKCNVMVCKKGRSMYQSLFRPSTTMHYVNINHFTLTKPFERRERLCIGFLHVLNNYTTYYGDEVWKNGADIRRKRVDK